MDGISEVLLNYFVCLSQTINTRLLSTCNPSTTQSTFVKLVTWGLYPKLTQPGICESLCQHLNAHIFMAPQSTDQNRGHTARLTREPVFESSNPLFSTCFQKRKRSTTTPQQHALLRPCCSRIRSCICLQSCLLHPMSVKLPLDL